MRRILLAVVFVATAAPLVLVAQRRGAPPAVKEVDVKAFLDTAAKALGADTVNTLEFSATGANNAFGQAWGPNRPWPAFKITSYTATIDYRTPAMRVDLERTNPDGPARGGGGLPLVAPQKQSTAVSAKLAWNINPAPAGGAPAAAPALAAVNDRLLQLWITPYGVIKAARADAGAKADSNNVLTFKVNDVAVKATFSVDNTVWKVETRADTPMLGDTVTETTYISYKDYNGVQFPGHIHQRQGGFQVLDLNVTGVKPNAAVTIPVPANVQQAQPAPAAAVKVDTQKLADGVYYLTGGTHHSVAVEFADHVVVVEAPLNDERVVAMLDAVKKAIPSKPIRYVVNSHNHFDHAGGLRAVVAEGATIVTQEQNKQYYSDVLALPHTLSPDRQEKEKKPIKIETVGDKRVLSDATHELQLIRVSTNHNDVMLVGYLPKEKMLIEADLFNPPANPMTAAPAQVNPVTADFFTKLQALKLDVTQIVGLHGRVASLQELALTAGKTTSH